MNYTYNRRLSGYNNNNNNNNAYKKPQLKWGAVPSSTAKVALPTPSRVALPTPAEPSPANNIPLWAGLQPHNNNNKNNNNNNKSTYNNNSGKGMRLALSRLRIMEEENRIRRKKEEVERTRELLKTKNIPELLLSAENLEKKRKANFNNTRTRKQLFSKPSPKLYETGSATRKLAINIPVVSRNKLAFAPTTVRRPMMTKKRSQKNRK